MKKSFMDSCETQEDLERLCREWQQRLRLQDWQIRIRWAEMEEIGGQGNVSWQPSHPDALIKVKRTEHSREPELRDPLEKTLIHELLHLHYWWIERNGQQTTHVQDDLLEQSIDKTARALLELKYGVARGELDSYMKVEQNGSSHDTRF